MACVHSRRMESRAVASIRAAAWIDASHSFDPLEAATRGVALRELPILVPLHTGEAIEMAGAILAADAADLLVLDLSLVREVPLGTRRRLDLRLEMFNALNRPVYGPPNGVFGSAAFGSITTAGDPRVVQLAVRAQF